MPTGDVSPVRAVWRLGDYDRFAREQMCSYTQIGGTSQDVCALLA